MTLFERLTHRTARTRIAVFGAMACLALSAATAVVARPRRPHAAIVDDLPWWWADPSNVNTIDMAGLPPGPHQVKISLVDANHEVFPGQSKTVTFTIPKGASTSHAQ